jgi:hypothetical protein
MNQLYSSLSVIGLTMLATAPLTGSQAGGTDPRIQALFGKMLLKAKQLKSMQYHATSKSEDKDRGIVRWDMEFFRQGRMFFNHVRLLENPKKQHIDRTFAFDGTTYQDLRVNGGKKLIESPNPTDPIVAYFLLQPHDIAYGFLTRDTRKIGYDSILDGKLWDDLAGRSTFVGREKVDGHECTVFTASGASKTGNKCKCTVSVSTDGYFPVKYIAENENSGKGEIRSTLRRIATSEGDIYVPVKTVEKDYTSSGELRLTLEYVITPASLLVNHEIPDSQFTIPRE